ncbi:MAG: hypothetical protein IH889_07265 [Planctomycetes bacterium]|nr:hypothetical protein [Planctomycetota bacterium]
MNRVYLVEAPRKLPSGKHVSYYVLRWPSTNGKMQEQSIGRSRKSGGKLTRAEAEEHRQKKEHDIGAGRVPVNKPQRMTLADFSEHYKQRRRQGDRGRGYLRGAPKLQETTIAEHDMTLRYMMLHFGDNHTLDSIGLCDASAFVDALEAGKLAKARRASARGYGMGDQTVRGHIRNAKAIFNWAHRFELVSTNPFAEFDGKPLPSDPNHYVPLTDFERVIQAAPSHGWRAMFALCRLAGLRREAARVLPWSGYAMDSDGRKYWNGVDWERKRVCLVGNHKTRCSYREVPICPRLYDILLGVFDSATDGAVTITGLSPNNLTRLGQRIVQSAGLTPWPKLYQAMRSSCENDWKQGGVAEATYCTWAGHSPTVSRKHYVAPTEAEYEAISRVA